MIKISLLAPLSALIFFGLSLQATIDLTDWNQEFLIETKKIEIPGYSDAFNPSLIRWKGKLLMTFRFREPITLRTHHIGIVWLDDDFNLVGDPTIVDMSVEKISHSYAQDPRLLAIDDRLYIIYSNMVSINLTNHRRMFIAELDYVNDKFVAKSSEGFINFKGNTNKLIEKNWVPFSYNGDLLLSYSISPHRVLKPIFNNKTLDDFSESPISLNWDWGEMRGGTTALLVDDEYLAFFHSNKKIISKQSNNMIILHYFMGAYTFKKDPPFEITRISPEPFVKETFYTGPPYQTWTPLRAVFPEGFVFDDQYIWVSYGVQDHEAWIVKIDKKGLLNSLRATN